MRLIIGFLLGFFVATMGVSGVANAIDKAVEKVKATSISLDTK